MSNFRLPGIDKRTVVLGRTGSGKTFFMRWLLSLQPIDVMPWIVFDYKQVGDFDLPYTQKIKIGTIPDKPGLYVVSPSFKESDNIAVDQYLFEILHRGRIGILFDEGASVPQREPRFVGLKTVLSQGRGLRVPVIFGSQRPRHINLSLLSEGDFFARFDLSFEQDADYVRQFMPDEASGPLDEYHCWWYDQGKSRLNILAPVDDDMTLERFEQRLRPKRRLL